eukprot:TRINITY_DN834_c0_g1_i2.p1 TRINITY_DN834_c0_g1~~TRINITY_DN834_c0_g1_i2.p1  ORF type:complete len:294 (-),score=88.71 TRINITY_DN834_c0_g1_i2:67-948(-)
MSIRVSSGVYDVQGRRSTMEDTHKCIDDVIESNSDATFPFQNLSYFGVFDGHGGTEAAILLEQHLHKNLFKNEQFISGNVETAINEGFEETDNFIISEAIANDWTNGSTGVISIICDNILYTANVGDSEAILISEESGQVSHELLTFPHKASDPDEKERIKNLGGHVFFNRVFGSLAVSRAFGDSRFKKPTSSNNFVSHVPYISKKELQPSNLALVLACDGLWDVMSYDETAQLVKENFDNNKDPGEVANALVHKALQLYTEDNVTVVVVYLREYGEEEGEESEDTVEMEDKE